MPEADCAIIIKRLELSSCCSVVERTLPDQRRVLELYGNLTIWQPELKRLISGKNRGETENDCRRTALLAEYINKITYLEKSICLRVRLN